MNKIKIAIIILIIAIIAILSQKNIYATQSVYENKNTNYKVIIEDDARLLTDIEEAMLAKQMQELTEYGNIIFKSIENNSLYNTASYARTYYNERFGRSSGTIFLIDMKYRNIYIFSNGKNYESITSDKAEVITDNIYKMATNKQYYKCAEKAYEQILKVLKGEKIAEPMKYICNILIAYIISQFVIFFIITNILNNKKAKNSEIVKNSLSKVNATKPLIQHVSTKRIYSPTESSGGGGSSGGRWPVAEAGGRWRSAEAIVFKLLICLKR